MKEQEPTIQDVLEAINDFSGDVATEFRVVNERLDKVERDIRELKKDTMSIRATMVDKDYLDRKLSEFKGEIMERVDREFVRKPRAATA